jgi:two-component system response regulator YesN
MDTVFPAISQHIKDRSHSKQKKLITQVRQYMDEQYNTDLSLQSLAEQFGISPSTLSRMFKEESGENFMDYIIRMRMDKAKEWLVHTDLSIKEISETLRYTTVHNFTRIFKQIAGVPPGIYRKLHRDSDS